LPLGLLGSSLEGVEFGVGTHDAVAPGMGHRRKRGRRALEDKGVANEARHELPPLRRGSRSGRRGRRASATHAQRSTRRPVYTHPLFGAIPLRLSSEGGGFDLDYRPRLPVGAVRGEPRKQNFCPVCHVPRYFFVDLERSCVDCDRSFIFGAAEQKHWYEELGFHVNATAVRCLTCRRARRADRRLRARLRKAVEGLRARPADPEALLELGRASVEHHERFLEGGLERAVGALRRAAKLPPLRVRRDLTSRAPNARSASFWGRSATPSGGLCESPPETTGSEAEHTPASAAALGARPSPALGGAQGAAVNPLASLRVEALYWEARAELARGRERAAGALLRRFLAERGNQGAAHVEDVRRRLSRIQETVEGEASGALVNHAGATRASVTLR